MNIEDGIEITRLDPWLKKPLELIPPGKAVYVGRYDMDIEMVTTITEALFLAGGPGGWHLWAVQNESGQIVDQFVERVASEGPQCLVGQKNAGLALSGSLQSDPRTAALALYKVLMHARFHYTMPCKPFGGGLLSAEELSREVDELLAEVERNSQAAEAAQRVNPAPILQIAWAFGLNPRPAGHNPESWWANCPSGGNHSIMITTSANQFGCGYCRKKGGPDELRQFCQDRGRRETKP